MELYVFKLLNQISNRVEKKSEKKNTSVFKQYPLNAHDEIRNSLRMSNPRVKYLS